MTSVFTRTICAFLSAFFVRLADKWLSGADHLRGAAEWFDGKARGL
ncbi:MAG: hypothetical protein Q8M31_00885 [Beijerinckiaceae bacterium]|nr:hypothetical protein [Beijerinckiaceae bacterium]